MSKNTALWIPLGVAILLSILFCFSSCSSGPKAGPDEVVVNGVVVPKLLPRKAGTGPDAEIQQVKLAYDEAMQKLGTDTSEADPYLKLATVFTAEGRVSGNGSYYSNATIRMLDKVLAMEAVTLDQRFQALSLKSAALLNLHRFKEALDVANEGLTMNDYNAGIYGALVDAHVELGHYKAAVEACDRMLAIRPDLRSYSRASYLRQIYGDLPGAATAMKMAVDAGIPGDESAEWARVILGDIYLAKGRPDTAKMCYEASLIVRPGYAPAEMGFARMAAAAGQYDTAIVHARSAVKALPEAAYVSYLGDLYAMKGDAAKAKEVRNDVLEQLVDAEKEAGKKDIRHNGQRELAQAYLAVGNKDEALKYAKGDWKSRPDNIDANDLLGWVLYQKGDYAGARACAAKTLATHTANPAMLYRAGLILAKAGEGARGDSLRAAAVTAHPYLDKAVMAGTL